MINNTIIKEMKHKVEKSRYDIRRTNVCFGKDEFEKYIDTFKPLLLENKPEESQPQTYNTGNNQTTTIFNKNKTKKFGNKKQRCCCNKCC